jgi:hypothetical protein
MSEPQQEEEPGRRLAKLLQTGNPIPQGPEVFIVECQSPNVFIDGMPQSNLRSSMRPVTLA